MSTFVLVHGAWHGGWCWQRVVPLLEAAGHTVVAPTLRGLAERAGELTPETSLDDHVDDVVAVLDQSVEPVVLVGHSYAGMVVRPAAARRPDRVAGVVLLDGWAGPDGSSLFGLAPEWFVDALTASAVADGGGWALPAGPAGLVGVTEPDDVAWLEARLTDHPLRTFRDPSRVSGAIEDVRGLAVVCQASLGLPFADLGAALGYPVVTIDSGHDAMVTAPTAVADVLLAFAAES
jgi:pimeloyl-ACP methyl ester carboxylesterase